jgi:hypothetical protein
LVRLRFAHEIETAQPFAEHHTLPTIPEAMRKRAGKRSKKA